jgi:hypothetical protein
MTEIITYLSPGGHQITRADGPATRIPVGTLNGVATGEVFVTEDCGASWDQVSDSVTPVSKDHHYLAFMADQERKAALACRHA